MTEALLYALVLGGPLLVTGSVLAVVPLRGRQVRQRVGWWLAGYTIPLTLTMGSAALAVSVLEAHDGLVALLGFSTAFVLLFVGHARTPDRSAWWLGVSGMVLAWIVGVVVVAVAVSIDPQG